MLFRTARTFSAFLVIAISLITGAYCLAGKIPGIERYYFYKESDYYTIKLTKTTSTDHKTPLQAMVLDNLIHSYVALDNPLHIEYEYERIYAEVLRWLYSSHAVFRSLTIGGGGYTFPRYMETSFPAANIDVVEIDPQVTKIVYQHLGLPERSRIRTFNTDGRWFVMNCKDKYDLIFTDAFNDLSIPYHLTTKEFVEQLRDILAPEGILMSNVIDNFQKGAFLPSFMKTLAAVFGEDNVHLISVNPDFANLKISTFIVIAHKVNHGYSSLRRLAQTEAGIPSKISPRF